MRTTEQSAPWKLARLFPVSTSCVWFPEGARRPLRRAEEQRGNERPCPTGAAASESIGSGLGIKLRVRREDVHIETGDTDSSGHGEGPQMHGVP